MRYLGWAVLVALTVVLPNLIWLGTSSVRLHNASANTISDVAYTACNQRHEIGELAPPASTFRFLEACGDDTLTVHVMGEEYCQTYVEGQLYHVDVTIAASDVVQCEYNDLFSSLLLVKLIQ